jgi:hypothetical protein
MKGFVQDIEDLAVKNDEFRRVLYTAAHCQLVVMALRPQDRSGPKSIRWISSFGWKRARVRRFLTA